ncbi:MAG: hypothetical protein ACJAQ4_001933 [Cryomorphaceae bacterium]|jgi:hypothetical protein
MKTAFFWGRVSSILEVGFQSVLICRLQITIEKITWNIGSPPRTSR